MAVQDPTTNYNWEIPNNGGDTGAWGNLLRTIIGDDSTGIDAIVKGVSNVANAALPKAGGDMSGRVDMQSEAFDVTDLGSTLSGAVTVDCSLGNVFRGIITGSSITLSFTNVPSGGFFLVLELAYALSPAPTITFPAAVKFGSGFPITLTAACTQVYSLFTRDGGTKWRAAHLANSTT